MLKLADKSGQLFLFQVLGNKMTTYNLATIFGPNLLRKQKNPEKEFTVQSFARSESTAVISVVQKMISAHHSLFMVCEERLLLQLDVRNKRRDIKLECLCECSSPL